MLAAGDICLDYSSARPDPAQMVEAGVKAVCRYIAGMNSLTRPKILTVEERDRLWDAGLGILLNWEQDAGGALGGGIIGKVHGMNCADMAAGLDYPRDLPIAVSVDVGIATSQLPQVADYFYQFKANCPWPLTIYGGTFVGDYIVNAGFAEGIWKAMASSWSPRPSDHVFLEQHFGVAHKDAPYISQWVASRQVDDNTVVKPFPVWTRTDVSADIVVGKDYGMPYRIMRSDGAQYLVDDAGDLNHLIDVQARFYDSPNPGTTTPRLPIDQSVSDADINAWWAQSEANRAARQPAVVVPNLPPPAPGTQVDLSNYGLVLQKIK